MKKIKTIKTIKENWVTISVIIGIIVIGIIATITYTLVFNENPWISYDEDIMAGRVASQGNESLFQCVTDGNLNAIYIAGPVYLERIIVGNDLSGSTLTIQDTTDSTGAALQEDAIRLISDTMSGTWEMGINFAYGIYATVSPSLYATFIYSPK